MTMRDLTLDNLDDLMQGQKADVFYSDPPWGQGNLKYWRTMNGQAGYEVDWLKFVERIKWLCERHVTGSMFIETGVRFEKDVVSIWGEPQGRYEIVYKAGNKYLPNILLGYGEQPTADPSGMTGWKIPHTVLSTLPTAPTSVLDCCMGLGTTAKIAKKLDIMCYANELNPNRASKTIAKVGGSDKWEVLGNG